MARRRIREEHENHERWLVSYADFITLLFAFFVVMYSISSVNEGKYRILSETLVGVFSEPDRSLKPVQIGDITQRFPDKPIDMMEVPDAIDMTLDDSETLQPKDDSLAQLESQFSETFSDLISKDLLSISGNELWVEIELKSGLLFLSGDSIPSNQAFDIIKRVADILKKYQNPLRIEGFTDNMPINTNQFPTNWELSSSRAAAVVRLLASYGVDPRRMAAVGYGQFQPVASNDTLEGRRQNRRVVLVISKNLDIRHGVNTSGGRNNPTAQ